METEKNKQDGKLIHISDIKDDEISLYDVSGVNDDIITFRQNISIKYLEEDIKRLMVEGYMFTRIGRQFSILEIMNLVVSGGLFFSDEKTKSALEKGTKKFIDIFGFTPIIAK